MLDLAHGRDDKNANLQHGPPQSGNIHRLGLGVVVNLLVLLVVSLVERHICVVGAGAGDGGGRVSAQTNQSRAVTDGEPTHPAYH